MKFTLNESYYDYEITYNFVKGPFVYAVSRSDAAEAVFNSLTKEEIEKSLAYNLPADYSSLNDEEKEDTLLEILEDNLNNFYDMIKEYFREDAYSDYLENINPYGSKGLNSSDFH